VARTGSTNRGAIAELEAWFVTGSQHLYGDDVLARVDANARHIASALDESAAVPVRIVPKPVVPTPETIAAVLSEADSSPTCIGVVAWMHTFSPAKMWIGGLTNFRKPLVHLHTQYNRELPELFEPGKECVAFRDADEMLAAWEKIQAAPAEFDAIVEAGKRRVIAEHTWEHRMARILELARERFDLPW